MRNRPDAPKFARERALVFTVAVVGFSIGSAFTPHPDADPAARWAAVVVAGTFALAGTLLLYVHTKPPR